MLQSAMDSASELESFLDDKCIRRPKPTSTGRQPNNALSSASCRGMLKYCYFRHGGALEAVPGLDELGGGRFLSPQEHPQGGRHRMGQGLQVIAPLQGEEQPTLAEVPGHVLEQP